VPCHLRWGLGLRSVAEHSAAASLASRSACREFCCKLDPHFARDLSDINSHAGAAQADTQVCERDRVDLREVGARQEDLSKQVDKRNLTQLGDSKANDTDFQAHLSLASASGAGQWLHTTPSSLGSWCKGG